MTDYSSARSGREFSPYQEVYPNFERGIFYSLTFFIIDSNQKNTFYFFADPYEFDIFFTIFTQLKINIVFHSNLNFTL